LPDEWANGEVKGLKARGGFTIDIAWKNGMVTDLKVKSSLGGNCRLMLHTSLRSSQGLSIAKGENSNPFFAATQLAKIEATSKETKMQAFQYDLATLAGKEYSLKAK